MSTSTPTEHDQPPRPLSAIDRLAEDYVDALVALSPITATELGLGEGVDGLDDVSPDGLEASEGLRRRTLERLATLTPADDVDAVTVAAMTERLGIERELHEAGEGLRSLNVIASPMQAFRDVLDLMPTGADADWATIARRLARIPAALDGWHASLGVAADRGLVAPRRQVEACIGQANDFCADAGFFTGLLTRAPADLSPAARADLERGVATAREGYAATAQRLAADLLPHAPESDACGVDRYRLASRYFLGAEVDLEESYAWGQEELERVVAQMRECAEAIRPGADLPEVFEALDGDPRYTLEGTHALQAWMQARADEAISGLSGTHFDIPDPMRTIECLIAPTHTGGIYYTPPSEDFTRPGRMWWSVPRGVTRFGTWRELSTVYHEGVPGHHLQVGQTMYRSATLNRWRRLLAWTSGHGEGWALYAERLMAELGYLDDPGDRLGMLDAHQLRAARVVLDIGVHCGLPAPAEVGGGSWDAEKAWTFLSSHSNMAEGFLRFELDRYLGWPGQAPSYKLGERRWLRLREETRTREGAEFDLAGFHRRALDLGGLGLDTLHEALLPRP